MASAQPTGASEGDPAPLVTLSAPYGSGGSRIGPVVAERLGVPFLDRAIPREVASRLAVPLEAALAQEEHPARGIARLIARMAPLADVYGAAAVAPPSVDEDAYRTQVESVIRELAASGGVLLGRAGAVVLASDPRALHVRLDGPPEARVTRAMALQGADEETATRAQRETDRAREAYVENLYGISPRTASLYHLVIDATALPFDTCIELIERAARARLAHASA